MCTYELLTSKLSKVIVQETHTLTYRQTDRRERNYTPRRFTGGQQINLFNDSFIHSLFNYLFITKQW